VGIRGVLLGRKVDVRLPGKGNSNFHGARPVHLIIKMIKWIRTSRLSIKNSLTLWGVQTCDTRLAPLCNLVSDLRTHGLGFRVCG